MENSNRAGEFFDRFADVFDTIYEGKRSRWMQFIDRAFRRDIYVRFERTFELFGSLGGKSVLDIGCGSGVYAMEALRRGASHVEALDPAPAMLELLRARLRDARLENRCILIPGAFPAPDLEPTDHAIVMGVMDYVQDAEAFLRALKPLVRESAAVSFPSKHWFRTPLRKVRYAVRNCPVFFYDEAQVLGLCRRAGFTQIAVHKIPGAGLDFHVSLRP
jgi:ubiquinone/menaquinone biosynthesis C-methylase UbiE